MRITEINVPMFGESTTENDPIRYADILTAAALEPFKCNAVKVKRSHVLTISREKNVGAERGGLPVFCYFLSCGHHFIGRKLVRRKGGWWQHAKTVTCTECYPPPSYAMWLQTAEDADVWLSMRVYMAKAEIRQLVEQAQAQSNAAFDSLIARFCPERNTEPEFEMPTIRRHKP